MAEITLCQLFRYSTEILLLLWPKTEVLKVLKGILSPLTTARDFNQFFLTATKNSGTVIYLFGTNIHSANLHAPKHHLSSDEIHTSLLLLWGHGCDSNILPLSTSLMY